MAILGRSRPQKSVISKNLLATNTIAFDVASNSGFQTASSDYNFVRTVNGNKRFLVIAVVILGTPGTTVTAVTDNYDVTPVALTRIGSASSGTGAGIIEFWGLIAPVTGTKNIRVQLSGSVTSVGMAASYTNVHQTSPYANFNSNSATNGAGAANASVVITTAATGSWVIAGIATTDATGVTAGQTSRNNVNAAASAGAGGEEDSGTSVNAGTTTMTYPSVDALAVWLMSGFELRPTTASTLATGKLFHMPLLDGLSIGGPFFANPLG